MAKLFVFDVNETLLNVRSMEPLFAQAFGDGAALREWFNLLLLHSEVATLAGPYFDFATIGRAALQMVGEARGAALSKEQEDEILAAMASMPAHPDVPEALRSLQDAGYRMVTLTNSSFEFVERQMHNSGLYDLFERNFSVDTVRCFKPAPKPYQMVASELGVEIGEMTMVAAHAWDIVGAMRAGCEGAFVARPGKVLFPLAPRPAIVGKDLMDVARQIIASGRG